MVGTSTRSLGVGCTRHETRDNPATGGWSIATHTPYSKALSPIRAATYFTLAGHVIERQDLSREVGRGSDRIPAVVIARLGLHRDLHGHGLGGTPLADASRRIVDATDIVAARFVVVGAASDNPASFYARYGYRPIPGTRRLVREISDLARYQRSD